MTHHHSHARSVIPLPYLAAIGAVLLVTAMTLLSGGESEASTQGWITVGGHVGPTLSTRLAPGGPGQFRFLAQANQGVPFRVLLTEAGGTRSLYRFSGNTRMQRLDRTIPLPSSPAVLTIVAD